MPRTRLIGVLLAFSVAGCAAPAAFTPASMDKDKASDQAMMEDKDVQVAPMTQDEKQKCEQMMQTPMTPQELQQNLPQQIPAAQAEQTLSQIPSEQIAEDSAQAPSTESSYSTQQRFAGRGWRVSPYRWGGARFRGFYPYSLGAYGYNPYFYRPMYYYNIGDYYYPYYYYNNYYYPYYYPYGGDYYYPFFYNTGAFYRPYYYYGGRNLWWRSGYLGSGYRYGGRGWMGGRGFIGGRGFRGGRGR